MIAVVAIGFEVDRLIYIVAMCALLLIGMYSVVCI